MSLRDRLAFADLCNERGIRRAVEVGTDCGIFAEQFLEHWDGEVLVCVDPWAPYPHMPYDRMPDLLMAAQRLMRFGNRVRLLRAVSPDVVPHIQESQYRGFRFVYLDGEHLYESVRRDINAWWDALPSDGILAGHDYMPEAVDVRRAVDEFAAAHGLTVEVTEDTAESCSWWVEKP